MIYPLNFHSYVSSPEGTTASKNCYFHSSHGFPEVVLFFSKQRLYTWNSVGTLAICSIQMCVYVYIYIHIYRYIER